MPDCKMHCNNRFLLHECKSVHRPGKLHECSKWIFLFIGNHHRGEHVPIRAVSIDARRWQILRYCGFLRAVDLHERRHWADLHRADEWFSEHGKLRILSMPCNLWNILHDLRRVHCNHMHKWCSWNFLHACNFNIKRVSNNDVPGSGSRAVSQHCGRLHHCDMQLLCFTCRFIF